MVQRTIGSENFRFWESSTVSRRLWINVHHFGILDVHRSISHNGVPVTKIYWETFILHKARRIGREKITGVVAWQSSSQESNIKISFT